MGCGSSSLKGEQPTGLDQPQPIRKVQTNFSTIDYDQNASANQKRRMTEYAPEDTIRNRSEGGPSAGVAPGVADGEKVELEPYQTRESNEELDPSAGGYPHENPRVSGGGGVNGAGPADGVDPTSGEAKDRFAQANDPAHGSGAGGLAPPGGEVDGAGEEGGKRKGSWLDRLKDRREEISDEDMKKYTGKTKAEMKEFVETGTGVGARQKADHTVVANGGAGAGGGAIG